MAVHNGSVGTTNNITPYTIPSTAPIGYFSRGCTRLAAEGLKAAAARSRGASRQAAKILELLGMGAAIFAMSTFPMLPRPDANRDQPDNRQIIRDMLAPTDYEITESENGQEALAAIAKQQLDLILMDNCREA